MFTTNQQTWVADADLLVSTPWQRYVRSLYFSIATLTTIGYGDVVAQNTGEEMLLERVPWKPKFKNAAEFPRQTLEWVFG